VGNVSVRFQFIVKKNWLSTLNTAMTERIKVRGQNKTKYREIGLIMTPARNVSDDQAVRP
jgi:hypothetical protein